MGSRATAQNGNQRPFSPGAGRAGGRWGPASDRRFRCGGSMAAPLFRRARLARGRRGHEKRISAIKHCRCPGCSGAAAAGSSRHKISARAVAKNLSRTQQDSRSARRSRALQICRCLPASPLTARLTERRAFERPSGASALRRYAVALHRSGCASWWWVRRS